MTDSSEPAGTAPAPQPSRRGLWAALIGATFGVVALLIPATTNVAVASYSSPPPPPPSTTPTTTPPCDGGFSWTLTETWQDESGRWKQTYDFCTPYGPGSVTYTYPPGTAGPPPPLPCPLCP
jgi:hypothetical protein